MAGGAATAALGVALHCFIATGWATVYGVLYQRWAALRRLTATRLRRALAAAACGVLVWLAMNLVIVRLSYARPTALFSQIWWVLLLGHPVVVGLPIVWIVRSRQPGPVLTPPV